MLKFLINKKISPDTCEGRSYYGSLASVIGIITNILLAGVKIFLGIITGSISIVADAINNAMDSISSVLSLVGFKLSSKPADKDHPFGHERYEYITGFVLAFIIVSVGIELGRSSINTLLSNTAINVNEITLVILGTTILLKLALSSIYKYLGTLISSDSLHACAIDSRNDVISTLGVLFSAGLFILTGINIDGYVGIAISLFVLITGINMVKQTIDPLLGTIPDENFVNKIKDYLLSQPNTEGVHDFIVHNYGPNRKFASVHLEMNADINAIEAHDIIDNIEHEVMSKFGVHIVVHHDPIVINETTIALKERISNILLNIDQSLHLHDFRLVEFSDFDRLLFDIEYPYECKISADEITQKLYEALEGERKYQLMIQFDRI